MYTKCIKKTRYIGLYWRKTFFWNLGEHLLEKLLYPTLGTSFSFFVFFFLFLFPVYIINWNVRGKQFYSRNGVPVLYTGSVHMAILPPPQSPKRTSFADSLLCVRTSGCVCVLKDGLLLSNAGIASVTHNFGWAWFSALRKLTWETWSPLLAFLSTTKPPIYSVQTPPQDTFLSSFFIQLPLRASYYISQ